MTTAPTKLRVGFVPYTPDMSGPSDRRRLLQYARLRGLTAEPCREGGRYDVVFLSSLADITHWSRAPRGGARIVYDLSDSYLHVDPGELVARIRGPAKFALRHHRHLEWRYHESLERMCRRADAVMCSTPEQRDRIVPFNGNVHPVLDFQGGAASRVKTDFASGDTLHLVWEGQGRNLFGFGSIAGALRRVAKRRKLALHLITDLHYKTLNAPIPPYDAKRTVARLLPGVRAYLYEHNEAMLPVIATACDLAVIPMVRDMPLAWMKAENKLLLFWRMGLPTLTEDTPAYVRTMKDAGVPMACSSEADWEEALERWAGDEDGRRDAAARGRTFAETEHGEAALARKWDAVLASVVPS